MINGGEIASESTNGAGIGGGYEGNGGDVYVSGGSIFATTSTAYTLTEKAGQIGHGQKIDPDQVLDSGNLLDKPGGSPVYLTEFETEFNEATNLMMKSLTIAAPVLLGIVVLITEMLVMLILMLTIVMLATATAMSTMLMLTIIMQLTSQKTLPI